MFSTSLLDCFPLVRYPRGFAVIMGLPKADLVQRTPTWYTNWAFSARNRPQFWPLCVVQKVGSQPVHLNPVIATLHVTRFALHPDVPQHPSKAQGRPWSLTWCLLWRPPPLVGVSQSATKRIPERKERKRGQSHDPGAPHPLQPPLRAGHSAHGAPDSRNRPL